ncbi:unnamed protein product [Choristocarpus tenellus]
MATLHPDESMLARLAHVRSLVEQQQQEEKRKMEKREANRKAAHSSRARKRELIQTMAKANEEMRRRTLILSLLPDMILAVGRDGVVTYASENCKQFLKYSSQEVEGKSIFDLVAEGSHDHLRELLEESLGAMSKEAIASALRLQGTSVQTLKARSEKAEESSKEGFSYGGYDSRGTSADCRNRSNSSGSGGSEYAGRGTGGSTTGGSSDSEGSENKSGVTTNGSDSDSCSNKGYVAGAGSGKDTALPLIQQVPKVGKGGTGVDDDDTASSHSGDSKGTVRVDPELQCRINAHTNAQKSICKLQVVCKEKCTSWCEVRTAMRLVWSKEMQLIIPIEVVCSFQLMQEIEGDEKPGMVARLQEGARRSPTASDTPGGSIVTDSNGRVGSSSSDGGAGSEGGCSSDGCGGSDDTGSFQDGEPPTRSCKRIRLGSKECELERGEGGDVYDGGSDNSNYSASTNRSDLSDKNDI